MLVLKKAAELVGTIVRSMNLRLDDFPHTGAQSYGNLPKSQYIPRGYSNGLLTSLTILN
jgi:hypothetical protein